MTTVEQLYNLCEKLDNAKGKLAEVIVLFESGTLFQHGADFDAIIAGVSGDEKAKKLAAQLIFRYFSKFADKGDQALDALFALCENPDINVRERC